MGETVASKNYIFITKMYSLKKHGIGHLLRDNLSKVYPPDGLEPELLIHSTIYTIKRIIPDKTINVLSPEMTHCSSQPTACTTFY